MNKVLITLGLLAFSFGANAEMKALDKVPPKFVAETLKGKNVSSDKLMGKVVLVNFWASWCEPCKREMKILNELYKNHKDSGLVVLGVNVDQDIAARDAFLDGKPIAFPIIDDSERKIISKLQPNALPATFFINKNGKIKHLHRGVNPKKKAKYNEVLSRLLSAS